MSTVNLVFNRWWPVDQNRLTTNLTFFFFLQFRAFQFKNEDLTNGLGDGNYPSNIRPRWVLCHICWSTCSVLYFGQKWGFDFIRVIVRELYSILFKMYKMKLFRGFASGAPNDNFRKNICSEDNLRSRIFGTFVVKFLACLPLLGFSDI